MINPMDFVKMVYEHDTHRSSKKENSISCSSIGGSLYKAKLTLGKKDKDQDLVALKLKRSSTIGTAFHEYAAGIIESDDVICEAYNEKSFGKYTISGSVDILAKEEDGTYTIMDWKTGYGKVRNQDNLDKDKLQMSMYRWLFSHLYTINTTAHSIFISQSNNVEEAYPIELMELDEIEDYLDNRLYAIDSYDGGADCDNPKYNPCNYCDFICQYRQ